MTAAEIQISRRPQLCLDCPERAEQKTNGGMYSRCNPCRLKHNERNVARSRNRRVKAAPPALQNIPAPSIAGMAPPIPVAAMSKRDRALAAARYAHDEHTTRARSALRFGVTLASVLEAWDYLYPTEHRLISNGGIIPWL